MEFEQPLHLVSPKQHGTKVKDAHWLLSGHNAFKQDFHAGPDDHVYGPQMAGATKRAKSLLGYPAKAIDGSFGQQIYQYLLPTTDPKHKPLPTAFKARRAARMRQANKATTAKAKALAAALADAHNAVHESPPGSNNSFFGKWYGLNYNPWCAMFVTYRLVMVGFTGAKRGSFASYVGAWVDAARHAQRHLALTTNPEPGDLVAYNGDEHIAFFVKWINREKGVFQDVGGNTSAHDGSPSNGGECAVNTRSTTGHFRATAFIRVGV